MDSTTQLGSGLVSPDRTTAPSPVAPAADDRPSARADLRRRLLVGAAFAGPVGLAAQYVLSSAGLPRDEAGPWLAGLAEDPVRSTLSVVAYLIAMLGTVAGAGVLALAGRRRAPMLSGIAAAMLVAGAVGGGGFAGIRLVAVVLAEQGGPEAADTWTAVQTGSPFLVLVPLVLLAALGTFVGAAAVVRARQDIAVWAAPAMAASFVLAGGEFPVWVSVLGEALAVAALVPVARAALRA